VAPAVLDEAGIPTDEEEAQAAVDPGNEPEASTEEPAAPKSPLQLLEDDLEKAISDEDYELAAQLRDDITRLKSEQN
jgi:protein-arginine kinase activator protein McsA